MAKVRQIFNLNGNWTAPAGVGRVQVSCIPISDNRYNQIGNAFSVSMNDGTVWAWGDNAQGALGANVNAPANMSSPIQVVGGLQIKRLYLNPLGSANSWFMDALGNIYGSGANAAGQIGNNSITAVSSPALVVGGIKFTAFPTGSTLGGNGGGSSNIFGAIDNFGNIWMWGLTGNGSAGNNTSTAAFSSPVQVVGGITFTQLAIGLSGGSTIVYGLDTSQNIWAWGTNSDGLCGNNSATSAFSSPVMVVGGIKFQKVFATWNTFGTVALDVNGNVWVWGGQGGSSAIPLVSSPVMITGGIIATQLFCTGGNGTAPFWFILDNQNQLWGYGNNSGGQLGTNDLTNRSSPTLVVGGIKWKQCWSSPGAGSASGMMTLGLDVNNNLWAWGANGDSIGILGNGTTGGKSSPVQVAGGLKWQAGTVDNYTQSNRGVCGGITLDGMIYNWGDNTFGELGQGTTGTTASSPLKVLGAKLANTQAIPQVFTFDVVPGTTYPIVVNPGLYSYFGQNPLITFATQVVLDYEQ